MRGKETAVAEAKHTRTIKLQLMVLGATKEERTAEWRRLGGLLEKARRAKNCYMTFCYGQDGLVDRVCHHREAKTKEERAAIKKEIFDLVKNKSLYGRLERNAAEKEVRERFPDLPSCITNPMCSVEWAVYHNERDGVRAGERSLRSYKRGGAIAIAIGSIGFEADDKGHRVNWNLGRKGPPFTFAVVYGQDKGGFRRLVQAIIDDELEWGTPNIQKRKRDGKLFLNVPIKEPERSHALNPDLVVGVDVGVNVLAYAGLSEGPARWCYGSEGEQRVFRRRFQDRQWELAKAVSASRGGHGRQRKVKAMDSIRDKERCKVTRDNHYVSRRIVDFALDNGAGTIRMEDLSGIHEDLRNRWLYRNWNYYGLQTMIEQKAERKGIQVEYVPPAYTSRTCIHCGHVDKKSRDSKDRTKFVCTKCGAKEHADYVGAVNVARRGGGNAKRLGKAAERKGEKKERNKKPRCGV